MSSGSVLNSEANASEFKKDPEDLIVRGYGDGPDLLIAVLLREYLKHVSSV